jgi:hypothetical protein
MANIDELNQLKDTFKTWLYVEDDGIIDTICATKVTHMIEGDPVWLQIIGASSGGKTEYLRAYTQEEDVTIDDLTEKTFVSGFMRKEGDPPELAQRLANHMWYIYDLSILMSKRSEERSKILSDMRLIYDGRLVKEFGNRTRCEIDTPNNTLICASTPVIDATMLEDQALGTRFIQYRLHTKNRASIMEIIDRNADRMEEMRASLKQATQRWFSNLNTMERYVITEQDARGLQLMSDMTCLLRTSVQFDRHGEASNLATPEDPGRHYKQMRKMYTAYRMIGLDEGRAMAMIRKLCVDSINPIRIKLLRVLKDAVKVDDYGRVEPLSTTRIHSITGLGKKTIKNHLGALSMIGIVDFHVKELDRMEVDQWRLLESNLNLLLSTGCKVRLGRTLYPIILKNRYK